MHQSWPFTLGRWSWQVGSLCINHSHLHWGAGLDRLLAYASIMAIYIGALTDYVPRAPNKATETRLMLLNLQGSLLSCIFPMFLLVVSLFSYIVPVFSLISARGERIFSKQMTEALRSERHKTLWARSENQQSYERSILLRL